MVLSVARFGLAFLVAIVLSLGSVYLAIASGHPAWGWALGPLILLAMDYVGFAQRSAIWLLAGVCGNIAAWTGIVYALLAGLTARRSANKNAAA